MLKRLPLPDYTPDTPLTTARGKNLIAMPAGYRPARAFSSVASALPGMLGGASFIGSDGTSVLLGGTATDLYSYAAGAWTSEIGTLAATVWRFDQFDDLVIGVNGAAPIKYDIVTGNAAPLDGSPPVSDIVATVRDQLFLAGDPAARNAVTISGYANPEEWSPGTNQSLYVPFPSGGDIMGIAGGETGVILQQRSVKRAVYTGDPTTVWQFDEISRNVGCMAKGSVAQAGDLVFFLSDQGFKVCDRNQVLPIGSEKVDRTFFGSYSRADIVDKIRAAVDPQTTTVKWSMPGSPGQIWSYDWTLQKWSPPVETDVSGLFSGFTATIGLEELDALYPSGLDTMPYSLDASIFAGGNPLLFVITPSGVVGTLTGSTLAASLSLPPLEVEPGRRIRIKGARVVGDITAGTVSIDARARAGDAASVHVSGAIRDNGRVPLRANGRHTGITLDVPSHGWTYMQGVDLDYAPEGAR